MRSKVIRFWIGIAAIISVAGTTAVAGTYTKGLSAGGDVLLDGGIRCNTSVIDATAEPTVQNTEAISAGAAAAPALTVIKPVSDVLQDTDTDEQAPVKKPVVEKPREEEPATPIDTSLSPMDAVVVAEENLINTAVVEKEKKAKQTKIEKLEDELEAELEAEAAAQAEEEAEELLVAAGATAEIDVSLPEEGEEEDDVDTVYGYSNLGIAIVDDHLNVRETADDSSHIVGKMSNDSGCEILDIVDGKAHIVSGSVEGYVSTDYILTGDLAVAYANQIVKKLATVSADGLKVRTAPDMEAPVVNMVAYGEELEVVEELEDWVKVLYDGQEVYVNSEYVSVGENLRTALNMSEFLYGSGVSDVRVSLCEYAKQFIGNRYVWGGTSLTKGADCSGYVLSIFAKYGISLPHSSRAQANMGRKVSVGEARPGDLVFYSKGGRINHVAIYIGGGQVVHASSPKYGIRITSVYYRTPTTVRRIIQD